MTWVEAMDNWLTFVDGKSQFYLRRSSVLAHFSRSHLVMWKLLWATLLYVAAGNGRRVAGCLFVDHRH